MSFLTRWMPAGTSIWGWGLGVVAVLGLVWTGAVRGDLRPAQLSQRAQAQADSVLSQAGFGWARLEVDDATARLVGRAPDQASLVALQQAAAGLLGPYVGLSGVFMTLEQRIDVASAAPMAHPGAAISTAAGTATPSASAASAGSMAEKLGCERALRITFSRTVIRFVPGSVSIGAPARQALEAIATVARDCPAWRVVITGPADSRTDDRSAAGSEAAEQRARGAATVLAAAGVPAQQIETRGADSTPAVARPDAGRIEFQAVPVAAAR